MKYKAVFLDADDTIFDFQKSSAFSLESVFNELLLPYSLRAFAVYEEHNSALWREFEKGLVSKDLLRTERFRRTFEALGLCADCIRAADLYLQVLSETVFYMPGAPEIMQKLRKYPVVFVTNGIAAVQKGRIGKSGLAEQCAGLVISEEAGCAKPNPGIFEYAMGFVKDIPKKDIIMVGDSLSSDIKGAVNAGIDSCWYNPSGKEPGTDVRPDYEIHDLRELMPLIEGK